MLITTTQLLNSGLPISDEIATARLERAIHTAEHLIVRPRLGDELYTAVVNGTPTESPVKEILNGGVLTKPDGTTCIVSGLYPAMYHLSFAALISDTVNATTFGSVVKKDEYSDAAGLERLTNQCRMHVEIGLQWTEEIAAAYGIDNSGKYLPDWWEELI